MVVYQFKFSALCYFWVGCLERPALSSLWLVAQRIVTGWAIAPVAVVQQDKHTMLFMLMRLRLMWMTVTMSMFDDEFADDDGDVDYDAQDDEDAVGEGDDDDAHDDGDDDLWCV